MSTPYSSTFATADWNSRYTSTAEATDGSITDSTSGLLASAAFSYGCKNTADGVLVLADGAKTLPSAVATATARVDLSVPETFTFEFDFKVVADLPQNFSDPDQRIFIGASGSGYYVAGVLVSKEGLALAPDPLAANSLVRPLGGTASFLDGSPVTVRIVVDGTLSKQFVYITKTAVAYEDPTGAGAHDLMFTLPTMDSTLSSSCVLLAVRAAGGPANKYGVYVSSARVATGTATPQSLPVASIGKVGPAVIGRKVLLDGGGSYAPTGGDLSFTWSLMRKPVGSLSALSGGAQATAVTGSAATNDSVVFTYKEYGHSGNVYTAKLLNEGASRGLTLRLEGTALIVSLGTNSAGAVVTTATDLIQAVNTPGHPAYSVDAASLFRASSAGGTGAATLSTGEYPFSGGIGSTQQVTGFVPDKTGTYVAALRVTADDITSRPAVVTVVATASEVLLRHRPATDFVWTSLPDFWAQVQDRDRFTTAWSAASQVVAGQLVEALQTEFSRSLRDVSTRYERRWLSYPAILDVPGSLQTSLVRQPHADVYVRPSTDKITSGGGQSRFKTYTKLAQQVDPGTGATATPSETLSGGGAVIVLNGNGVVGRAFVTNHSATGGVELSTEGFVAAKTIASGNHMYVAPDPSGGNTSNLLTCTGEYIPVSDLLEDDLIVFEIGSTVYTRNLLSNYPTDGGAPANVLFNTVSFKIPGGAGDKIASNGVSGSWKIVRPVPISRVTQTSYFDLGNNIDLTSAQFKWGDTAILTVDLPVIGKSDFRVPILHVTKREVYVDWSALEYDVNVLYGTFGTASYVTAESVLNTTQVTLKSLAYSDKVPMPADVLDIPVLGESATDMGLTQNVDYTLTSSRIEFEPHYRGDAVVTAGSKKVVLESSIGSASNLFLLGGDLRALHVESVDGNVLTLSTPAAVGGTYPCEVRRYSFNDAVPEDFWAEVTTFSNLSVVEANFGVLVGLSRDAVSNTGLDYAAIVRAMCFALVSGPQMGNLMPVISAFAGVPYIERAGQITNINPDETESYGKLVVKSPGTVGYTTYYYPNDLPLSTNPLTNRTLAAVPLSKTAEYYLPPSEQESLENSIASGTLNTAALAEAELRLSRARQLDDATVPAMTAIVRAGDVHDFVSSPEIMNGLLSGPDYLRRYHTFAVDVGTGSLSGTAVDSLRSFIEEWKPAHTDFLLFSTIDKHDDVAPEVEAYLDLEITVTDAAYSSAVTKSDPTASAARSAYQVYPDESTLLNNPPVSGPTWTYDTDVYDLYESGYVNGVLDDYSGDGSWNDAHSIVDMVNSLDGDLDVPLCKLWVPIEKDTSTPEFVVGEEIWLTSSLGVKVSATGWPNSMLPPVLDLCGAGAHPKIAFGVYSPQNVQPFTYLLLGFASADGSVNSGDHNRLRALEDTTFADNLWLKGGTSGAMARIYPVLQNGSLTDLTNQLPSYKKAVDPTDPDYDYHRQYFHLERVFQLDSLIDRGPIEELSVSVYQYVPNGGTQVSQLASTFTSNDLETQMHPYTTAVPDDQQLVPSFGRGYFSNWDNFVGASLIVWGYESSGGGAVGEIYPSPASTFDGPAALSALENMYVGFTKAANVYEHVFHGFVNFEQPGPVVLRMDSIPGGTHARIEGFYFLDDDATRSAVPDNDPGNFDGTVGGSWAFFIDTSSGDEYAALSITFETGNHGAKTVLGVSGASQTSTGHIIEAEIPALPDGDYDIMVRNYRPYELSAVSGVQVDMKESILLARLNASAGVYSVI